MQSPQPGNLSLSTAQQIQFQWPVLLLPRFQYCQEGKSSVGLFK
jgi:hypothetical protein